MNAERARQTLPVNLLLRGQLCVVVGGGMVAARKVTGLLAAGARVRVVAPEVCDAVAQRIADGEVAHTARVFEASDVNHARLVFAATDDRVVNREVLAQARDVGALCCCVDGNWPEGDFMTPAVLQREGLSVAISTGGQSCRKARMVKETLDRHLESIEAADLLVIGTSHDQLPLAARESLQLSGEELEAAGRMLMHVWGIHEFMLLCTCNRIELVAVASESAMTSGLVERVLGLVSLADDQWYCLSGWDAFSHFALVTAGMLSQSPGEYHVAAQVKDSLAEGVRRGWAGGMLQAWGDSALHISKHIKNEAVGILQVAEIEDVSIFYAANRMGEDWADRVVMVIGTGMVGRCLIEKVLARGGQCLWCCHRTRPELDADWGDRVRIVSFNEIKEGLGACDMVFCATEAKHAILQAGHAPFFEQERQVFIFDLGVPRNVDPVLETLLPEGELVNLDRLKRWSAEQSGTLDQAMAMSQRIIEEHRRDYNALIQRFQGRNKTE